MNILSALLCLFIFILHDFEGVNCIRNGKELVFVQAIWRHGDRAPTEFPYPNDSYNESFWPRGWGQLTDAGAARMKNLGTLFKTRYSDFINLNYSSEEVTILSSDSDRAIVSAIAFSNGLFNTTNPVPVRSNGPNENDPLLRPSAVECDYYNAVYKPIGKNVTASIKTEYSDFISFLQSPTGYGDKITVSDVAGLLDIYLEQAIGLAQPDWVYKKWPQYENATSLDLIREIYRRTRIAKFSDPRLSYVKGGTILGDFVSHAQNVAQEKQKEPKKMLLYSSHDGTVLSLLYALGIADDEQVPFSGCVIMEVSRTDAEQYVVEFYYVTNNTASRKTVPGCSEQCPVDEFVKLTKSKAFFNQNQFKQACQRDASSASPVSTAFYPVLYIFAIRAFISHF